MMHLSFDQWMDISGFGGIPLYLAAHWWRLRNIEAFMPFNLLLRIAGLLMILIPLLFRWYLSASMILTLSLIMAAFSLGVFYRRHE